MSANGMDNDHSTLLEMLRRFSAEHGLCGEIVEINGALIYQAPWVSDCDITGVFLVIDPGYSHALTYLTLPCRIGANNRRSAVDFVVRNGFGLRFGALEFDEAEGTLRVRTEAEIAPEEELTQKIPRLFERAMELARKVSPGWQAICGKSETAGEDGHALRRYCF